MGHSASITNSKYIAWSIALLLHGIVLAGLYHAASYPNHLGYLKSSQHIIHANLIQQSKANPHRSNHIKITQRQTILKIPKTRPQQPMPTQPQPTNTNTDPKSNLKQAPEKIAALLALIAKRIQNNINYPESAQNALLDGKIILEFTLNKHGEIQNTVLSPKSASKTLKDSLTQTIKKLSPIKEAKGIIYKPVRLRAPIIFHLK